jgi:type II secretory pathway predicted ATPase ExeA
MYETYFALERRPFSAAPLLDFYFPAHAIDAARRTLTSCIERGSGPGVIFGPAGTGKTFLSHLLAEQYRSSARVAMVTSTHLATRRALLQVILFEIGLPYRDMDDSELRLSIIDHLRSDANNTHGMVLLVDEAHSLPWKLLEEIRMLSNLVVESKMRVHVVLAGNSVLEERLASPRLSALNQRLVARCYLGPLNREETLGYVQSQIASAGGNAIDIFAEDALQSIYQISGGIPRLINQICEHALILASAGGRWKLNAAGIEEAWADLQQLPLPPPGTMGDAGDPATMIEFGNLDDAAPVSSAATTHREPHHAAESPLKPDAERRLAEIEQHVTRVGQEMAATNTHQDRVAPYGPAAAPQHTTAAACQLARAYDPFSEPYEMEELIVVDRFHKTPYEHDPADTRRPNQAREPDCLFDEQAGDATIHRARLFASDDPNVPNDSQPATLRQPPGGGQRQPQHVQAIPPNPSSPGQGTTEAVAVPHDNDSLARSLRGRAINAPPIDTFPTMYQLDVHVGQAVPTGQTYLQEWDDPQPPLRLGRSADHGESTPVARAADAAEPTSAASRGPTSHPDVNPVVTGDARDTSASTEALQSPPPPSEFQRLFSDLRQR